MQKLLFDYLPKQNLLNNSSSSDSEEVSPIISPRYIQAALKWISTKSINAFSSISFKASSSSILAKFSFSICLALLI